MSRHEHTTRLQGFIRELREWVGSTPQNVHGAYPATWARRVQFDPADPRRVYTETLPGDPPADYREVEPEGGWIHCQEPS